MVYLLFCIWKDNDEVFGTITVIDCDGEDRPFPLSSTQCLLGRWVNLNTAMSSSHDGDWLGVSQPKCGNLHSVAVVYKLFSYCRETVGIAVTILSVSFVNMKKYVDMT